MLAPPPTSVRPLLSSNSSIWYRPLLCISGTVIFMNREPGQRIFWISSGQVITQRYMHEQETRHSTLSVVCATCRDDISSVKDDSHLHTYCEPSANKKCTVSWLLAHLQHTRGKTNYLPGPLSCFLIASVSLVFV